MHIQEFAVPFENTELRSATEIVVRTEDWLVCLHGIQSNRHLFNHLKTDSRFNDFSLLAIDAVGFGDSDKPEDFSYSIADQAQVTNAVMDAAGVERAYLIGHSLGGMIGTRLLQEANAELLGFVNCEGNLTLKDAGMSRTIVSQGFDHFSATGYSQIKNNLLSSDEPGALLRGRWLQSVPDYAMYRTCQAIVEQSLDPSFAQLFYAADVPRMYLYGDANVSKAERIPDVAGLKKVSVPGSGHFMLLDNPAFSYRAIERFLDEPLSQ